MKDTNKQIISIEISNELKEKLRTEAYYSDMSISALIRSIINKELDEREVKRNGSRKY